MCWCGSWLLDASALNYNAAANTDDGSCIGVVSGCTDDGAINYNSNANVDDGSCIMPAAGFEIVNSNTGNNALIYIDVNAFSFNAGDNLGAFFIDENGEEQCAGVLSWDPSGGNLIVVHGDDPNTAAIDGAHGEIIWKTNIDGQAAVLFASYGSYGFENILGNNQYAPNAAYLITGFTIALGMYGSRIYGVMMLLQMLMMDHVLCCLVKHMQMLSAILHHLTQRSMI